MVNSVFYNHFTPFGFGMWLVNLVLFNLVTPSGLVCDWLIMFFHRNKSINWLLSGNWNGELINANFPDSAMI